MSVYYIASLKHTHRGHEHITFWGPGGCGYTCVVGERIGEYDAVTASSLNDGIDFIAVPVEMVGSLLSPEPYWKPGARFYDQRGPVVVNDRKTWNRLIAGRLHQEGATRPKPEVFRGQRRAIYTE